MTSRFRLHAQTRTGAGTAGGRSPGEHYASHPLHRKRAIPRAAAVGQQTLRAALILLTALALPACQDFTGGRLDRQQNLERGTFGQDDRVVGIVSPGRFVAVDQQPGRFVVAMRASAPWPDVRLVNGNNADTTLTINLANVDLDAAMRATLGPLRPDDRRHPDCATSTTIPPFDIDPPSTADPFGSSMVLAVVLPACSRLSLTLRPPQDARELRTAVVGATDASRATLDALFADLVEWDAHHAIFLGNISTDRRDVARFERFLSLSRQAGIPVTAMPGKVENKSSVEEFQRTFGATTFSAFAGQLPMLFLDSSAGTLAGNQLRFVEDIDHDQPGLAFMPIPPLPPVDAGLHGLHSQQQAARLLNLLHRADHRTVFASSGQWNATRTVAGVTIHQLDAREAPRYMRITITDPWGLGLCPPTDPDSPDTDEGERDNCPAGPHVEIAHRRL